MPSCCEPTISLPWMVSLRRADVEPATWMPSKTSFSILLSMKVVEFPSRQTPHRMPPGGRCCWRSCRRAALVAQGDAPGVVHREPVEPDVRGRPDHDAVDGRFVGRVRPEPRDRVDARLGIEQGERLLDEHGLVVGPGGDLDGVARFSSVDGGLDRVKVLGHLRVDEQRGQERPPLDGLDLEAGRRDGRVRVWRPRKYMGKPSVSSSGRACRSSYAGRPGPLAVSP